MRMRARCDPRDPVHARLIVRLSLLFDGVYGENEMLLPCAGRVYLDGDYHEPSPDLLPAIPMVEEVKDCSCIIA